MIQVKKEVKKLNRGQRLVVKTLSSTSNKDEEKKNFPWLSLGNILALQKGADKKIWEESKRSRK